MRYIALILLVVLICCKTTKTPLYRAESTLKAFQQPSINFYKSYHDFKFKKPFRQYQVVAEVTEQGVMYNFDHFNAEIEGKLKTITPKEYPTNFLSDNEKLLIRYYKGKYFAVLASGKFCYYMDFAYTTFVEGPDGSLMTLSKYFGEDEPALHYFAKGENGEILPLTNEILYPLLEKNKIMDKYLAAKQAIGLVEYCGEFSEVFTSMFQLINKKM